MSNILPQGALLAARLQARFAASEAIHVLAAALGAFDTKLALVSSFGAESAVLLHLAAQVDPSIDVIFVDTGKIFGETKSYREQLIETLKLSKVVTQRPSDYAINSQDAKGDLWLRQPDACCALRKVAPLHDALKPYSAWITGRKRGQTLDRSDLKHFEWDGEHVKINPLAGWSREEIETYMQSHALPHHSLKADGFLSIGCMPCTDRVEQGQDSRSGRWSGIDKQECGIHQMRAS
jgi:phosphoadenosine phosphosulfate reductase